MRWIECGQRLAFPGHDQRMQRATEAKRHGIAERGGIPLPSQNGIGHGPAGMQALSREAANSGGKGGAQLLAGLILPMERVAHQVCFSCHYAPPRDE